MSDKRNDQPAKRRDFLKLLGFGGVAGGAAIAGAKPAGASEKPVAETGYRESAHVKKFYETARF